METTASPEQRGATAVGRAAVESSLAPAEFSEADVEAELQWLSETDCYDDESGSPESNPPAQQ